jgi:hypothetical protein
MGQLLTRRTFARNDRLDRKPAVAEDRQADVGETRKQGLLRVEEHGVKVAEAISTTRRSPQDARLATTVALDRFDDVEQADPLRQPRQPVAAGAASDGLHEAGLVEVAHHRAHEPCGDAHRLGDPIRGQEILVGSRKEEHRPDGVVTAAGKFEPHIASEYD